MPQVHFVTVEKPLPLIPWWRAEEVATADELEALGLTISLTKYSEDSYHGDREQRAILKRLTSRGEWKGYRIHSVGGWRHDDSFTAVIVRDVKGARNEVDEGPGEERRRGRRRSRKPSVEDSVARSRERLRGDENSATAESSLGHESAR